MTRASLIDFFEMDRQTKREKERLLGVEKKGGTLLRGGTVRDGKTVLESPV